MFSKKFYLIVLVILFIHGCKQTAQQNPIKPDPEALVYTWMLLGPDGKHFARAVTDQGRCPKIKIDGREQVMALRAKGGGPKGFEAILSCETEVSKFANNVTVAGKKLKLLNKQPSRIVVIGDTGCRMKPGDYQNCNNVLGLTTSWPFPQIAAQVAKLNADLIIHTGDYFYRESPCPPSNKGCNGPSGFTWGSWEADFFNPGAKMLPSAPWLMTRGNHEDCNRAWRGWFYLLDPYPLSESPWQKQNCLEQTETFKVNLGGLRFINMDSATLADAFNPQVNPKTVARFTADYDEANNMAQGASNTWLVTHRPIWAVASYHDWKRNKDAISLTDPTMQAGLKASKVGGFDESFKLLLSGHVHNFQVLNFNAGQPSMMVVGNSGTRLSPKISDEQLNQSGILEQLDVMDQGFFSNNQFAYVLLERQPKNAWLVSLIGLKGQRQNFLLRGKKLEKLRY